MDLGGVELDSQSMPGALMVMWKYDFTGGSLASDAERNLESHPD